MYSILISDNFQAIVNMSYKTVMQDFHASLSWREISPCWGCEEPCESPLIEMKQKLCQIQLKSKFTKFTVDSRLYEDKQMTAQHTYYYLFSYPLVDNY